MHDGTRRLEAAETDGSFDSFQEQWQAVIVILAGGAEGNEIPLDRERVTLGRGPDVDQAFEDDAMSRQHVAIEFAGDGFRVQDLGSTNGTQLNGSPVGAADLAHGDRIQLGEHVFQFVCEKRERAPRTYVLPDD